MYSNLLHQSASNSTLKRTHSSEEYEDVQLPQLEPDMYLRVYTHKSLRRTCASGEYEDNERLSLVGEKVFDAAVTTAQFYERPLLEMEAKKRDITSWMIDSWVRRYQMREKVRCHPEQFETLFSPEETKTLFYAYVGAVFVNLGMDVVQAWINALIGLGGAQRPCPLHRKVKNLPTPQPPPIQPPPAPRPQFISPQPNSFVQFSRFPALMPLFSPAPMANNALIGLGETQRPFPLHRKVKNLPTRRSQPPPIQPPPAPRPQFIPPQPGSFVQFSRFPAPMPLFSPVPMAKPPPPPKLPCPTTPTQFHQAVLPQFNEKASQQGMVVEYTAQSSGPPHTGTWTVNNCAVTSGFSIFRLGISVLLLSFLMALYCFYYCM
ncbi:hypothetical protein ARMGADRAFT_1158999 [Armillaria gallica]|uniref:RNase III domain-containing protein n=1 Tax=Armillaria gallica TaxID=47427 RepID=A0A2H3EI08_ARMGA|nr:hypothetical protein ARMGADRAFT_1158999 [Armillaria gallica]